MLNNFLIKIHNTLIIDVCFGIDQVSQWLFQLSHAISFNEWYVCILSLFVYMYACVYKMQEIL